MPVESGKYRLYWPYILLLISIFLVIATMLPGLLTREIIDYMGYVIIIMLSGVLLLLFQSKNRNRTEKERHYPGPDMDFLVRHNPNALAIFDKNMRYLHVSDRFIRDYRINENVIGKSHYEVFPEIPDRWKKIHESALSGNVERSQEDSFERMDGTTDYNRWECRPWYTAGNEIGGLILYSEVITGQRLAEQALFLSEQKYRTLLEHTGDCIWEVDTTGHFIFVSENVKKLIGYEASDLTGRSVTTCLPANMRNRLNKLFLRIKHSREPVNNLEVTVQHLNGEEKHFEINGIGVFDKDGDFYGFRGIAKDITRRKRNEENLRNSEENYRFIIQNQTDLIVRTDGNGKFLFVSPSYCELFGKSREELLGNSFVPLIHEDDRDATRQAMEDLKKPPYTCYVEQRANTVKGIRWIAWKDKAIVDEKGNIKEIIASGRDITARKEAEQALLLSEERYRSIFENSGIGIFQCKESGEFIEANTAFCQMFGYKNPDDLRNNLNARADKFYVYPEKRDEIFNSVLQSNKIIEYVNEFYTRDKKVITCKMYLRAIRNHNNLMLIEGFIEDVTRQKLAEKAIQRSKEELETKVKERTEELIVANERLIFEIEERNLIEEALQYNEKKLRSIIENSPDGILLINENGDILEWNKGMENITGIPALKAFDMNFWLVSQKLLYKKSKNYVPVDEITFIKELKTMLSTGSSSFFKLHEPIETQITTPGGIHRYVQSLLFITELNQKNYLASFSRDITDNKNFENAIRQSEAKLRAIFDNTVQSFIIFDLDGNVVSFNKVAQEKSSAIFGRELMQDINANQLKIRSSDTPIDLKINELKNGDPYSYQVEIHGNNKNVYWYEFNFSPVYEEKEITGIFMSAADITERKNAEASIYKALEKQKSLNDLKTQFVSTVSHEFRTPLATIYSNTQLIDKFHEKWEKEKKDRSFKRIYDSVQNMTTMLDDLSLLGKEQSGRLRFDPEPGNLKQYVKKLVEESHLSYNLNKRIVLKTDLNIGNVYMDTKLMNHILNNVLSNAVKYSPANTKVNFSVMQNSNSYIEFRVQDFGIGIPDKDLPNIYEPFHRASNIGDIKGTGLGMSIVKQCVELHQGKINLFSKENVGTTVSIKIPYVNS